MADGGCEQFFESPKVWSSEQARGNDTTLAFPLGLVWGCAASIIRMRLLLREPSSVIPSVHRSSPDETQIQNETETGTCWNDDDNEIPIAAA